MKKKKKLAWISLPEADCTISYSLTVYELSGHSQFVTVHACLVPVMVIVFIFIVAFIQSICCQWPSFLIFSAFSYIMQHGTWQFQSKCILDDRLQMKNECSGTS